ncbi:hypothetical protein [Intestinibacter sp.]|uniref:hypothetical protein n=1 Tax=Intestinibacter sp. TaxID=1965304 RepID=UPI003AB40C30
MLLYNKNANGSGKYIEMNKWNGTYDYYTEENNQDNHVELIVISEFEDMFDNDFCSKTSHCNEKYIIDEDIDEDIPF